MKIATYNVNGITSRLPVLLRWLEENSPDVACLQEIKTPDEKFPVLAINALGYQAIWHGQKSWNGVAVLAKNGLELNEVGRGLSGDPEDAQSRFIEARVNDVRVCCLYLPNGNPAPGPKFDYKLSWMKRLHERANDLVKLDEPVVMLGDYNVIPEDIDAYRADRYLTDAVFMPESREAYKLLVEQGWTDAIRKLHPDEKIFTYWDYFRNSFARNSGIRIDHLLINPAMAPRLVATGVDVHVRGWEKSSDHAPTWLEITS